jgi:RNA polymerase sigma-B factor
MTRQAELTVPARPDSAARARSFLREQVQLDTMRHSEADLLVTELVGNVIRHSPETTELTVRVEQHTGRQVMVTVAHAHPSPVESPTPGVGFMLLDRLSMSWGQSSDTGTLATWFVLRAPGTTSIPADVTDEELFERMDEDPAAYSDELVRRHHDLARGIARRFRGKGVDDEDLIQVAQMAMLKAIQRYDPSKGELRPYAAVTMSGELKRLLRDRGWAVKVPRSLQERSIEVARTSEEMSQRLNRPPAVHELAEMLDLSEQDVTEAIEVRQAYVSSSVDKPSETTGLTILESIEDPELSIHLADQRLLVEEALGELPERQKRILHLRFNEDMTQSEIADVVGISQMHVSRLLASALETLRSAIGEESRS